MPWFPALVLLSQLACFSSDKGGDDDDGGSGGGGGWDLGMDSGTTGGDGGSSGDGGSADGGSTDGGSTDGGSADGGSADGGSPDGGSADGGFGDGGSGDGGSPDGAAGTWRGPMRVDAYFKGVAVDSCSGTLNITTDTAGAGTSPWTACPFTGLLGKLDSELRVDVALQGSGEVIGDAQLVLDASELTGELGGDWDPSTIQAIFTIDGGADGLPIVLEGQAELTRR